MCKIITLTNVSKVKNLNKLVKVAAELVSKSEHDGFGYAIQGTNGVFGERTTSPAGFESLFKVPKFDLPFTAITYNRFGTKTKATGGAIFHGRTSTNAATLLNTHPIIKRDWTLIHNGVVSNHGPEYDAITTNDTEHLLEYLSTTGISGIEQHITGYYAVAAFAPDSKRHVFKDSIASLYAAYSETIDSIIFATRESHISELCKAMRWTHAIPEPVQNNTYLVFDKGELITQSSFKPRGRTAIESKYASLSLGRELDADDADWSRFKYSSGTQTEEYSNLSHEYWSDCGQKIDESEYMFLQEMKLYADASYTIKSYDNRELTPVEFNGLDLNDKLDCIVIRGDGTVCSPVEYYAERIFEGAS